MTQRGRAGRHGDRGVREEAGQLISQGRRRTYTAVTPASEQHRHPQALLLVLHGSNQTGGKVRAFSGHVFDEMAARGEAVVVYPDAYKGLWNDARASMQSPARRDGIDDVAFVAALIDYFRHAEGIRQVFAVGYSNGGQMVIRLAHEIPDRLCGVAAIAATQPTPDNLLVTDAYLPLPVLLIHGTGDPLVPYSGGVASLWGFRPRGTGLSAVASAEYFAARNGITAAGATYRLPRNRRSGRTSVTLTRFEQPGKKPVVLYTIEGGGHVIPNPRTKAPFLFGRTNQDINAAEVIWDFFRATNGDRITCSGHT